MTITELLAVAKPILFNTEMVRAIQNGTKTATRRIVKCRYNNTELEMFTNKYGTRLIEIQKQEEGVTHGVNEDGSQWQKLRPYIEPKSPYKVGDILYVRETWCKYDNDHVIDGQKYAYRADTTLASEEARRALGYKWKPSIHMPKEAARIFLRVTDVRVERLQDMTEDDAFREGWHGAWCEHMVYDNYPDSPIPCMAAAHSHCPKDPPCNHSVPELFGTDIWNETIKKSDLELYGWKANPWVWAIEFERIEVTKNG